MKALAIAPMAGALAGPDERAEAATPAAFEAVMRLHERLVLRTALRLLGDMADAQDASQEVFFKLYRNRNKVTEAARAAWLYRVTVNVCHDLRRKRPAADPVEDAAGVQEGAPGPHQLLAQAERHRALLLSLRMLPDKERAALVLRDLEGLPAAQVARTLGSSEATVRSQAAKARVKMRQFMERYWRRRP
jgi:RNA polymerase sigma-70 factor, ECF subfamily